MPAAKALTVEIWLPLVAEKEPINRCLQKLPHAESYGNLVARVILRYDGEVKNQGELWNKGG